ncbi:major facilitator superfamily transporter [Campylobacter blaseri]|uniref:Bcr/CflA family drug resistance efflux transporter n=1 Tax=Campylobacter blaseri TaxID=2042961 RepID=A0A2P8R3C9_9BACT|nr:multidrug effflux MFS transporter [Campylobacter blaseri]PSM52998.1 Bcr/CflA family drug resistance efflux transporter [Campylobacter blaseri]PSM54465.1 Bcr/CflA family drug resistance efflux transporter [Campylobacter blaseri]QKF85291.1 major facilitator superfamily transporter [Campylobacter blaseri]
MKTINTTYKFDKIKLVLVLAFMSAIAPLSIDMYLPALTQIREIFETDEFYMQLSLAVFFIAFSFGQLIYGPLSDIYGRKKPLYFGITIFVISSFACAMVDSVYAFIFFRFTQALGGSAGIVIARAVINDKFELNEAASMFAIMMVVASLAPMLAPTFGSLILHFVSWRIIFIMLFSLGVMLLFMIYFWLKDSSRVGKKDELSFKKMAITYIEILKNRKFIVYALSLAMPMSAMFAYITGSSFVFVEYFGLSTYKYGIIFGLNALGVTLVSAINSKLVLKHSPENFLKIGLFLASFFVIILIALGYFKVEFLYFEIMLFLTLATLGFIIPNATSLAMSCYKERSAGAASAVLGAMQFAFAGGASFSVGFLKANNPLFLSIVMGSSTFIALLIYIKGFKE